MWSSWNHIGQKSGPAIAGPAAPPTTALLLREQLYQTVFKTNVNSVVGKMDIESFIDLLTSTDSDVLRAVASFIYTANIT